MAATTTTMKAALVVVACLLAYANATPQDPRVLMPAECPTAAMTCCLSYRDEVCGGATRGACTDITASDDVCNMSDYGWSLSWLTDYFTSVCVCTEHFTGAGCEQCAFGWSGENCDEVAPVIVRRNFESLSADERQYVIDAFIATKNTPSPYQPDLSSWDWFAGIHYVAQDLTWSTGLLSVNWHRYMVMTLERLMQLAINDESFALPYWDWQQGTKFNTQTLVSFCGNGDLTSSSCDFTTCWCPLPQASSCWLNHWKNIGAWGLAAPTTVARDFGCFPSDLPSAALIEEVVALESFVGENGFQNQAALMHASVHHWVGGSMSALFAASDPIFLLHHVYVDLLFTRWIQKGYDAGYSTIESSLTGTTQPRLGTQCMDGFFPLVTNSRVWQNDTTVLGYTYDYMGSVLDLPIDADVDTTTTTTTSSVPTVSTTSTTTTDIESASEEEEEETTASSTSSTTTSSTTTTDETTTTTSKSSGSKSGGGGGGHGSKRGLAKSQSKAAKTNADTELQTPSSSSPTSLPLQGQMTSSSDKKLAQARGAILARKLKAKTDAFA